MTFCSISECSRAREAHAPAPPPVTLETLTTVVVLPRAAVPGVLLQVYGAQLLLAAQQKEAQLAVQAAQRKGGGTSLRLRREREREQKAKEEADARLPPSGVRAALAEAAARKRDAVGEQARQRAQAYLESGDAIEGTTPRSYLVTGHSHSQPQSSFFTGQEVIEQMGRMQLKEAQREIRAHQNKQQLRQVLASQAAEKRMRELREHAHTYGEPLDGGAALARSASKAAVGPTEAEQRALAGVARRSELEAAIALKQRERKALRKEARQAQRELDDAAAKEEVCASRPTHSCPLTLRARARPLLARF